MGKSKGDEETILKSIRFNIHLICTESTANPDIVLAANHVERVRDEEDVGPALERSKPAITQVPVITHECRGEATTHAVFGGLVDNTGRSVCTYAIQIRAQDTDFGGLTCSVSKRQNVVENTIKAGCELVDIAIRE